MSQSKPVQTLVFSLDREGTELPLPFNELRDIDSEFDVQEFGLLADDDLPIQMGSLLSSLLGQTVHDEEGQFDLLLCIDGQAVANLVLLAGPCDETVGISGSRLPTVSERVIVEGVRRWLSRTL